MSISINSKPSELKGIALENLRRPSTIFCYIPSQGKPMASHGLRSFVCLALLALGLCVQGTLGGFTCENLDRWTCAFAVSSFGLRCVLEKSMQMRGQTYSCHTTEIEADKAEDWIETDECIEACGLDRNTLGISSDSLLDWGFTEKLCAPQCYQGCPNIVDLYFNLAGGEGVFLPKLCETQATNTRRGMVEFQSSGTPAVEPRSLYEPVLAPEPSPAPL